MAQMAGVYEEKLGKPDEATAAYREVLTLDPTSQVALGALESLFMRQRMWAELAENWRHGSVWPRAKKSKFASCSAWRRSARRRWGIRRMQSRATARSSSAIPPTPKLWRLSSASEKPRRTSSPSAKFSNRCIARRATTRSSSAFYEVQVRRADDANRKVELLHGVAQLHEDAAGDANAAFDTYARALAADPANEATQEALDRLARVTNRFPDLARVFEDLASHQSDAELGSRLYTFAARVVESDVGDVERAIELYRKVLSIDPTNLGAAESLQTLFQSIERFADMSLILQAQGRDPFRARRAEGRALPGRDTRRRGARASGERDLRLPAGIAPRPGRSSQRRRAREPLPEGAKVAGSSGGLLEEGRPGRGREEKKLITHEVGAVYERELGNVQSSIDTYQKVSSSIQTT